MTGKHHGDSVVEQIKKLWNSGRSYSMIAGELRLSRSQVSGVIHRLRKSGFDLASRYSKPGPAPKARPRSTKFTQLTGKSGRRFHGKTRTPPAPWIDRRPKKELPKHQDIGRKPYGHGHLLADMDQCQCRWPTGLDDKGRHLFCGERTEAYPYCPGHR